MQRRSISGVLVRFFINNYKVMVLNLKQTILYNLIPIGRGRPAANRFSPVIDHLLYILYLKKIKKNWDRFFLYFHIPSQIWDEIFPLKFCFKFELKFFFRLIKFATPTLETNVFVSNPFETSFVDLRQIFSFKILVFLVVLSLMTRLTVF